ncbi:unnamed protein product [Adineta steineri]|uniref:Transmembrane protein n=1 Tax=Adineta steineri TaxID=433720 RepID=A0A814GGW1_9BILA|nr:unnamed protein product [Adineta steineri]CAF1221072.1 unnamed protein product [Adineta steineri]
METKYSPTPANDGINIKDLEILDMMIDNQQHQVVYQKLEQNYPLVQQPWQKRIIHSKQIRNMSIIILLICFISVGIIGYIHYNTSNTNKIFIEENQDTYDEDGSDEQIPQLRSDSNHLDSDSSETVGQMYIYFRQSSHSFEKLSIPVARYNRENFPLKGQFINLIPELSIFVDPYTKQTIIDSKKDSSLVYVLPSLVDKHRKYFSVAELIKADYVSLSSNGMQPQSNIDMSALFQSNSLRGSNIPKTNSRTGGFMDGFHTNYELLSIPEYDETSVDINEISESEEKNQYNTEDKNENEEYNNNDNEDHLNQYESDEESKPFRR